MFTSTQSTPTTLSRALLLLLLLASLLAFRYGWFTRGVHGRPPGAAGPNEGNSQQAFGVLETSWDGEFAHKYNAAKKSALAQKFASPPWYAGEYYEETVEGMEDTHSETIFITPGGEYFSEVQSCMTSGPINFGSVRAIGDGRLELCPAYRGQPGADRCWKANIIRWGERQYLISDSTLPFFLQSVENGLEPRDTAYGGFLMRRGDWNKKVGATPIVPKSE